MNNKIICKTDIEKGNNHLNWGFLQAIMEKMGYCIKWISWMKLCISSTHFSILMNGTITSFLQNSRDLRHGNPLSPYLFIMAMETLSYTLKKAHEGGFSRALGQVDDERV